MHPASPQLISLHPTHARVAVRRQAYQQACEAPHAAVHDHGVLSLHVEGTSTLWMGATYALEPGDLCLIPEGMPHYMREVRGVVLWGASLCVGCLQRDVGGGALLAEAFAGVRGGQAAVRRLDEAARERVRCCLEALEGELREVRPGHEAAVSAHLALLGVEVLRATPRDTPAVERPLAASALAWIEAHAHEGPSLRDVAQAVHRTPAHVAAVVKAETGRTVGDWIMHARMSQARQLLLRSDETIEAVAARVGFASPSHFHRTFRNAHALSPDAWRRLHRDAG